MKKFSTMRVLLALILAAGLASSVTAGPVAPSSSAQARGGALTWLDPLDGSPTCQIFCDGNFWSEPDWAGPAPDVTDCEARCWNVCGVPLCPFLY